MSPSSHSCCRIVLNRDSQVQRESWRARACGETLLVFTRKGLVSREETDPADHEPPPPQELPELILKICGPLGAHDAANFIQPEDGCDQPWLDALQTAADRTAVPLVVISFATRRCVLTYCSRRKNPDAQLLPSVERYVSPRIGLAAALARECDAEFRILSGKFGVLSPEEPIPYYDYLLPMEGVPAMIDTVIPMLGVFDEIIFAYAEGDYLDPYRAVVVEACTRARVALELRPIKPSESVSKESTTENAECTEDR